MGDVIYVHAVKPALEILNVQVSLHPRIMHVVFTGESNGQWFVNLAANEFLLGRKHFKVFRIGML